MAIRELYVSTTGSATAGGTSEGAAKVSGTTWTAASTTVTATNINSGGTAVGDYVYLASSTGGYNTTWFRITSLGGDANTIVVHTAPGAGGAGLSWAVGGAVTLTIGLAIAQPGDRLNVKADGEYANTTNNRTFTNAGTIGAGGQPIIMRGYSSTIGDYYLGRTNQGALITTNMPTLSWTTSTANTGFTNKNYTICEGIKFQRQSATNVAFTGSGTASAIINCVIENIYAGASNSISISGNGCCVVNCDMFCVNQNSTAPVLNVSGAYCAVYGCLIRANNYTGITTNSYAGCFANNTFYGCTLAIIETGTTTTYTQFILNNTIYSCATAGITRANAAFTTTCLIAGNLITDCSGRAVDSSYYATGNQMTINAFNRQIRNSNTDRGSGDVPAFNQNTTAGNDYVSAGSDFRLLYTSPAIDGLPFGNDFGAVPRKEDYPAVGNVRSGTAYNTSGQTGTCAVPVAANVLYGVAVDATTGTLTIPVAPTVRA